MNGKVMSLRISEEMATELHAVARVEDVPISEAIRAAINRYIAACHADHDFQQRLKKQLEKDREVLERLAGPREEESPST